MLADVVQDAEEFDPSSMILDQAARLLDSQVSAEGLRALLDQAGGFDGNLWAQVAEQGWIAAPLPEAVGGFDLGWHVAGDLARLCGRHTASVPLIPGLVGATALAAAGLDGLATEVATGQHIVALALGEEGSDLPACVDGKLNGKVPHAAFGAVADILLLAVRSGEAISLACVELGDVGVTREPTRIIDNGRAGARLTFAGANATILGDAKQVDQARLKAATLTAFEQIGGAEQCLELACNYARERKAFGQPIGAFQAIKHKLADFYAAIEMARGCASAALDDVEAGSARLSTTAPAARLAATDAYEFAAVETIQVFGAIGVTWEAPAHHHYTRSRVLAVELGARLGWRDALVSALVNARGDLAIGGAAADDSDLGQYRARARQWLAENAPAHEIVPGSSVEERLALGRQWQALKAENGYSSITLPRQYGGGGGTDLERIAFSEEELQYDLPTVFYGVSLNMTVPTFAIYASDEAKAELLPPAISGEQIWCQLFSEPAAGSDLAGLRLTARRDGEGWRLNGQKVWTSWAQFSEWGYIATRTDPGVVKHKGLTCFYLNMKSPGIEVRPIRRIGGDQEINEVFFDDVYVPDSQRLGEVNGGFKVILTTLMIERYALNDPFAGGPKLGQFISLARTCRSGGRPAIEDGEVRRVIADCYAEWLGQESIHTKAMAIMASGAEPGPEGSIRKLLAAKSRQRLATVALELQGLSGLALDAQGNERNDFTHSWLDAPQLRIAGGTDDILRNTIAEKILGLPQDYRPDKGVPFNAL
jgi:alkylation response protein AidB-like acyl-CoA dehydrogenase